MPAAAPPVPDRSTGVLSRPAGSNRRRLLFLGGLAMLVLGGLVLGVVLLRGRDRQANQGNYDPPARTTYTGPLRKDNADDIHLTHARRPPTIDGALDEWTGATTFTAPNVILNPNGWKGAARPQRDLLQRLRRERLLHGRGRD